MTEWTTTTLGAISVSIRNGVFARRPNDEGRGDRILRISAVKAGRVEFSDARFVEGVTADQLSRFSVDPGDLLLTRYNGSRSLVGTSGLVTDHDGPVLHPDKLIRVVLDRGIADPRFVNFQLAAPPARGFLEPRIRTTAGQSGIAGGDVRAIPIVLPSLAEQRRIVDILEDHLSRLDAANDYLDAVILRVESLRAAYLTELVSPDDATVTLGELALSTGYGTSAKCGVDGSGPAVVRIPNVKDGTIDLADEKRVIDEGTRLDGIMLAPGDLLVVRTNGSRSLIGRSAVVPNGVDAAFASYLIRYVLDGTQVMPGWVHLMLERPTARRVLEGLAASSAGQYNLGLKKLDTVPIPVPSLDEQDRRARAFQDTGDRLRALHESTNAAHLRAAALRRALLAAAFAGQLTGRSSDLDVAEELAFS